MAAYLKRLHHVSLHVSSLDKTAEYLIDKLKFTLFAARLTSRSRQLAFRKGAAVFVVNESAARSGRGLNEPTGVAAERPPHPAPRYWDRSPTRDGDNRGSCLYDVDSRWPVDTACNVCFEVRDVERSFEAFLREGCGVLVPPTVVRDGAGLVTYTVVRSVVGNVSHTLIDTTRYSGGFLPGFHDVGDSSAPGRDGESVTHFDHITYACPRKATPQVMRWYEKFFGFQRFFIVGNEDEEEGFVIDHDDVGLRLTAMEYWKCSKAGISLSFVDKKEPDCKFVIAESLPKQGANQVDTFLEQHRGPGIQHIGLYTQDIVSTAHTMAEAGVQFFSPPPAYYTEVGKLREIEEAGHDPQMLAQHGILLDTDLHRDPAPDTIRYLLQVFSKPIFAEDTFFLELIERRGASGFGEGNITALWRSVQAYMDNGKGKYQGTGPPKTVRPAQH